MMLLIILNINSRFGVLAAVISVIFNKGMTQLGVATYLSASFFYFCLMIAVLFPLYFRFAYSKIYVFSTLPFYILFVLSFYVMKRTDLLENLAQIIQYYTSHQYLIWVTGFGSGLVLLAISCLLVCLVYKKTEL